jgi:hypothetical protein
MAKNQNHPLAKYHIGIADITSRFTFNHHPVPDRSGLIITPQGFGQPFFHRPTNTVGVLFSKIANNLQGRIFSDGRRVATAEQMEGCYIFGARRLKGNMNDPLSERENLHSVRRELRDDMDKARRELGERSRKHFTLYNSDNLYTNGRHIYEILDRKSGGFEVVFRMATYRPKGSFIPFDMNDKSLSSVFSRANKTIEVTETYEEARQVVARHWKALSSDLWSQRNIFVSQGNGVIAKKLASDLIHSGMHHGKQAVWSTFGVGTLYSAYNFLHGTSAGIWTGVALAFSGAVTHTLVHLPVEMGLKEYFEMKSRSTEAKSKLDIDAYGHDVDVSDHFKIQTRENLAKVCPHIDMQRFNPEDFEFLSLDQFSLQKDREQVQDNLQAMSLAGHLLFMGQRGFSSQAHILDKRTELRLFQSGVVRVMHERKDGTMVVYAQYRPEMCNDNRLRLAQCHIDQFEGQIVRLEYDRTQPTFSRGLGKGIKKVSHESMIDEINNDLLFSRCNTASQEIREASYQATYTAFSNPELPYVPNAEPPVVVAPKLSAILEELSVG